MITNPFPLRGNWSYPTTIWLGKGRIEELPQACQNLGIERPLLVTDTDLTELPMISNALNSNAKFGIPTALFSNVHSNPGEIIINSGVTVFRDGGHDGVIAFGGGSALDCGKAIAFMAKQTRPIWDFEDREDWYTRANPEVIAPIIGVPTTAGTGSEVGRAAVITDAINHTKKIIFHPKMLPGIVILDPELTVGLPATITAATGMDALSHNLEAYCSPLYHPMADGIALEGIRLIREWLPIAVADSHNLIARGNMLAAASMGATAFQKGLGAMHSLSHPCSASLGTHHGLTNAVVMPYVLKYNRSAIEDKLLTLAQFLDLPDRSSKGVVSWILSLRNEIGIPHTLAELGVHREHVVDFARQALTDPSTATNPKRLKIKDFENLYLAAIDGELKI